MRSEAVEFNGLFQSVKRDVPCTLHARRLHCNYRTAHGVIKIVVKAACNCDEHTESRTAQPNASGKNRSSQDSLFSRRGSYLRKLSPGALVSRKTNAVGSSLYGCQFTIEMRWVDWGFAGNKSRMSKLFKCVITADIDS